MHKRMIYAASEYKASVALSAPNAAAAAMAIIPVSSLTNEQALDDIFTLTINKSSPYENLGLILLCEHEKDCMNCRSTVDKLTAAAAQAKYDGRLFIRGQIYCGAAIGGEKEKSVHREFKSLCRIMEKTMALNLSDKSLFGECKARVSEDEERMMRIRWRERKMKPRSRWSRQKKEKILGRSSTTSKKS